MSSAPVSAIAPGPVATPPEPDEPSPLPEPVPVPPVPVPPVPAPPVPVPPVPAPPAVVVGVGAVVDVVVMAVEVVVTSTPAVVVEVPIAVPPLSSPTSEPPTESAPTTPTPSSRTMIAISARRTAGDGSVRGRTPQVNRRNCRERRRRRRGPYPPCDYAESPLAGVVQWSEPEPSKLMMPVRFRSPALRKVQVTALEESVGCVGLIAQPHAIPTRVPPIRWRLRLFAGVCCVDLGIEKVRDRSVPLLTRVLVDERTSAASMVLRSPTPGADTPLRADSPCARAAPIT